VRLTAHSTTSPTPTAMGQSFIRTLYQFEAILLVVKFDKYHNITYIPLKTDPNKVMEFINLVILLILKVQYVR
jgi:ribosome-binding ATPase YchF (GTP1/OBG family)